MTTTEKRHWFGILATLFGCLALVAAILPTWVLPLILPPKPVEQVVVDTAHGIKGRLLAKAKGQEYREPARKADWYSIFAAAAMSLGVLALVLAAVSFVIREPWRFAAAATTLGTGAILFQFSLAIAGALIAILLIAVILNAIGLSF